MGAEQADYRVRLYPAYHAHRDQMPAELARQWHKAPLLLGSLGWTVSTSEELEADDVMFSFARVEAESGGRALLLTGDRDLFGAVSERVAVIELRKGGETVEIGPAQVRERYGVEPALVPDFIALRGDPSDGLPGAPGIGAKTAAELLRRYGSLEDVLAAARAADRARRAPQAQGASGHAAEHAPANRGGAARERRAAAHVQADRDASADRRRASGRPHDTDFTGGRARQRAGMRNCGV